MTFLKNTFRNLSKWFGRLEETFLSVVLLAMIVLACLQILLRGVFSTGFLWADPLLRFMVIWAGLFGAAVATKNNKHIAIDLASFLVPARFGPFLRLLTNLFSATVCAGLAYAAITFVKNEAAYSSSPNLLGVPSWVLNLVFPIAFSLIAFRFLVIAVTSIIEIIKQLLGQTATSP